MIGRVAPSAPPTSFVYTPDGGLSYDGTWAYDYDAEDQLTSITSSSLTNGAIRVLNTYDNLRRRTSKTVQRLYSTIPPPPAPPTGTQEWQTIETRTFVYDGWNLIHETIYSIAGGATNMTEVQYFWGLDLSDSLQGAGGVGGLLAVSRNGEFYFPAYDNNGNVTKYIDESGNVVAAYEYDDFGRTISQSGPLADFFRHRFSTKYYDSEADLYCYGLRFYALDWHIWLNRDPRTEDGGINLYVAHLNNPLVFFDPLGLEVIIIKNLPGTMPFGGRLKPGSGAETHFRSSYASVEEIPGDGEKVRFKVTLTPPYSTLVIYFKNGLSSDEYILATWAEQLHVDSYVKYDRDIHLFKKNVEQIHDCPDAARKKLNNQWKWLEQRKKECIYYNQVYLDGPGGVHAH